VHACSAAQQAASGHVEHCCHHGDVASLTAASGSFNSVQLRGQ
jgi:hypothetical protein